MKPITRGKGKNKGFWVWEAKDAIYREPIRPRKTPNALNRRRVREMKGE